MSLLLFIAAQLIVSLFVWKKWKGTREQLASVHHELSSLQGIVDVSRDAIIGVTTEGVIMSWNRGARGIYGYTSKEALRSEERRVGKECRSGWAACHEK